MSLMPSYCLTGQGKGDMSMKNKWNIKIWTTNDFFIEHIFWVGLVLIGIEEPQRKGNPDEFFND